MKDLILVPVAFLVLGPCLAAEPIAEPAADPGRRLEISGEVIVAGYDLLEGAFGSDEAAPRPGDHDSAWLEGVARVRASFLATPAIRLTLGVAGVGTGGLDPFGVEDATTAIVEAAHASFEDLGGTGLTVTVGRQDLRVGDGFLIDDGYSDARAAVWMIPLRFWDALKVDWVRGNVAATAFAADLSSSFDPLEGTLYGLHGSWTPGEEEPLAHAVVQDEDMPGTYVGAGLFVRADDGPEDSDARLLSVRASMPVGPVTGAIEAAWQSGSRAGTGLGGGAYHADLGWSLPWKEAYLAASWIRFTGDDPDTADDETFAWGHYGSRDWQMYYLGEIVGSSLLVNTDQRTRKLEAGFSPWEDAWLRAWYLDIGLDTGTFWELPEGTGRDFAEEVDLALDWTMRDGMLTAWAILGRAWPRESARALYGDDATDLLQAGVKWTF